MLEILKIEDFLALTNQTFEIILEAETGETIVGPLEAELIEVSKLGQPPDAGRRQPFSVILRAPLEPVLAQQICTVRQEKLGTMALFLVPVGPDDVGMRYEAVFT